MTKALNNKVKLNNVISVTDYGAVGDGVADDTSKLQAAFDDCPLYGTVVFAPGKTYLVNQTLYSENASVIDLMGSTLKADSSLAGPMLRMGKEILSSTAITPLTVGVNDVELTLPLGITAEVGNLIGFESDTVRAGTYLHGMWAVVTEVDGQDITISTPFYEGFDVDRIEVWRGYPTLSLLNGTLDLTSIPAVANFTEGVLFRGTNIYAKGMTIWGSENAGVGLRADGEGALVEACSSNGFLNLPGISGGGRVGYGFAFYGNNMKAHRCQTNNCKHGFMSGPREKVAVNISYEDCQATQDNVFVSDKYAGSFDVHYNTAGVVVVKDCSATGYGTLLSLRAPTKVIGGRYIQTDGVAGQILKTTDGPYDSISFDGVEFYLASTASEVIRINSGSGAAVTAIQNISFVNCTNTGLGRWINVEADVDVVNVSFIRCNHSGRALYRTTGNNIDGLYIKDCVLECTEEAIRIVMDGASYTVDNLYVEGNSFTNTQVSSSANTIYIDPTTATKITGTNWNINRNKFMFDDTAGTGYAINISDALITKIALLDNVMDRGSFRCIALDGCDIVRGMFAGQQLDGDFLILNNASATTLTDVSVVGNAGNQYRVNITGFGVTKTRYVDSANNFVTYTP